MLLAPLQTDWLLELRPVFMNVLCHYSKPMVRFWTPLNTKAAEGWNHVTQKGHHLLICSTFLDLPFFWTACAPFRMPNDQHRHCKAT